MNGRVVVIVILAVTALFGATQWWFQTRAYYAPIEAADLQVTLATGDTVALPYDAFEGIDADTSPLRFRACLTLDDAGRALAVEGVPFEDPTPLIAPDWFTCFDAPAIGAALEAGEAVAVLAQSEIRPGADRVLAVFPDGRAFAWHQWNGTLDP